MMKDYHLWLKSGTHIHGKIEADRAAELLVEFRRTRRKKEYSFHDKDGLVSVDMRRVESIGFADITERHKDGM